MARLVDGLGFEELGQAGSQVASLWMTGSLVAQSSISGANIYSTGEVHGAVVNANAGSFVVSGTDVASKGTITAPNISGTTAIKGTAGTITNITGTGSVAYGNADFDTGSVVIAAAGVVTSKGELVSPNISGTTAVRGAAVYGAGGRETASAGAGSPAVYGLDVQAGTLTLGAGSDATLTFGEAFSAAPILLLSPRVAANNVWHIAGSLSATAAYIQGDVASSEVDWMAVGAI